MRTKSFVIAAVTAALAVAPVAAARPGSGHGHAGAGADHPSGHGKPVVMYVFKGTYVDPTSVDVANGNGHVKRAGLAGQVVSFDFSAARVVVGDVNADGAADLADVAAGDWVVVKVRAPKSDPGPQPFAARQLVDQTHPAAEPGDAPPAGALG